MNWVETRAFDKSTFGLQWKASVLEPWTGKLRRGSFPQYCKQVGKELVAIAPDAVPASTGLAKASFLPAATDQSYTSPDVAGDAWSKPGPKAGPFTAKLADENFTSKVPQKVLDEHQLRKTDWQEKLAKLKEMMAALG